MDVMVDVLASQNKVGNKSCQALDYFGIRADFQMPF